MVMQGMHPQSHVQSPQGPHGLELRTRGASEPGPCRRLESSLVLGSVVSIGRSAHVDLCAKAFLDVRTWQSWTDSWETVGSDTCMKRGKQVQRASTQSWTSRASRLELQPSPACASGGPRGPT